MAQPDLKQLARVSKLFEALDEAGRERLLKLSVKMKVSPGTVVCMEGQPGDDFFVVIKGRLQVSVDDLGTSRNLDVLESGAFFGEMAMLGGHVRQATVTAIDEVELVRFRQPAVDEVLAANPAVREVLNKVGLMRTEDTFEKLKQT